MTNEELADRFPIGTEVEHVSLKDGLGMREHGVVMRRGIVISPDDLIYELPQTDSAALAVRVTWADPEYLDQSLKYGWYVNDGWEIRRAEGVCGECLGSSSVGDYLCLECRHD